MLTVRIGDASHARIVLVGGASQMSKPSPETTPWASLTVGPGAGGAAPTCGAIATAPEVTSASAAASAGRTPQRRELMRASGPTPPTDAAAAAAPGLPSPSRT